VSRLLGVGRDLVRDTLKRHLHRRFAKAKLTALEYIAIDGISVRKGHKYLTLVMDLKSGKLVFVGDGRGADSLKPFRERLKRSRARIRVVATDMSAAYIGSVLEYLPGVAVVPDHFHVLKLMNGRPTELRRKLHRELRDKMGEGVLKGSRWILLKNPENLNQERQEHECLQEALEANEPLAKACYLKEELRQLWDQANKAAATVYLEQWINSALASGLGPLAKMGKTMARYRTGLLAWYDHPISSGPMEGINNKIKTLKRQASGYRDQEFFKLRMLGIHETRYTLTG